MPVSSALSNSKLRSGATIAGATLGVWERSGSRKLGSSFIRGISTRRWPSFAASAPIRFSSAGVRALPSVLATSTVTVVASGSIPKFSSAIRRAAAES